jgi:hypothetical protein
VTDLHHLAPKGCAVGAGGGGGGSISPGELRWIGDTGQAPMDYCYSLFFKGCTSTSIFYCNLVYCLFSYRSLFYICVYRLYYFPPGQLFIESGKGAYGPRRPFFFTVSFFLISVFFLLRMFFIL